MLVAVIAAPVAFFFLVTPKESEAQPTTTAFKAPPSKLAAVGLKENRDWDALPEMFGVWADRAYWKSNRSSFAYWNPTDQAYTYYFEARRTTNGYRFREIAEPHEANFHWDPDVTEDTPLRLYLPIRPRLEDPVQPLHEVEKPALRTERAPKSDDPPKS